MNQEILCLSADHAFVYLRPKEGHIRIFYDAVVTPGETTSDMIARNPSLQLCGQGATERDAIVSLGSVLMNFVAALLEDPDPIDTLLTWLNLRQYSYRGAERWNDNGTHNDVVRERLEEARKRLRFEVEHRDDKCGVDIP